MKEIEEILNTKIKWWRRYLPAIMNNKSLRLFTFTLWDCSYTTRSVGKPHFFDLLVVNHKKWWQLPICGFQVWY